MSKIQFGLISDIQYADHDDAYSYYGQFRCYRSSITKLSKSITQWNGNKELSFVMHLGDTIDCRAKTNSERDMKRILKETDNLNVAFFNSIGNHDCVFQKKKIIKKMIFEKFPKYEKKVKMKYSQEDDSGYYYYDIGNYRFIVLDSFDVSFFTENKQKKKLADSLLKKYNKNDDWDEPPLVKRNYVKWTGGIGKTQLKFFQNAMSISNKKIIIFSHCSLETLHCDNACLIWNVNDLYDVIDKYKNVIAVFNGHAHDEGYYYDKKKNIHHFCVAGMIESGKKMCFGTVTLEKNYLSIEGIGKFSSRKVKLDSK